MKVEAPCSAVVETANARVCVNEVVEEDGSVWTSVSLTVRHLNERIEEKFSDGKRTRLAIGKAREAAA